MANLEVKIVCQVCKKWESFGTINTDEANVLPNIMQFVRQEISKHSIHGLAGKWQINYKPR